MNEILLYYSNIYQGDNEKIYYAIKNNKSVNVNDLEKVVNSYKQANIKFLTVLDDLYPTSLFRLKQPPFVLYYIGNIDLLNYENKVYLINEIKNDSTKKHIENNIKQLVKNTVLVTNNYKDSEQELIQKYKDLGGSVIYLAKEGLDTITINNFDSTKDIILSMYPIKTHPKLKYFKQSNYIASGLADSLIYFSSKNNSKTHNLVNYFLNVGKDIYCFPGQELIDGNNDLIKNGARLITYIAEVINI
ncbi:DNA-processing protein DprA [Mycoplasma leonicaptivi]|uniref:DNA-processing protein DprA n=1 Tax=Mycoplasma leonicaptivi TaxID=36742 RepID=UPI000489674C|nr:DNA-processing protein DprA [Mycoplasma leonicaptivi]